MLEVKKIKSRLGELQALRANWESHAQEIVDFEMPYHEDIIAPETRPEGVKRMYCIYDSTATHAGLLFANRMPSLMSNPSTDWFDVGCEVRQLEEVKEVKRWLEEVKRILSYVFNKSNFYTADHQDYIDHSLLGTSAMFIGQHPRWKVYFDSLNIAECFPAPNQYGQIDTLYRRFGMSMRNMVRNFGEEMVSEDVRTGSRETPDGKRWIIHAVEPRIERSPGKLDKYNLPWQDIYLEEQTDHLLSEGGFREFPYVVTRQFVAAGQTWGWGLGMVALPDVKELQTKRRDQLLAGERVLHPALMVANDGFITYPIKLTRDGINPVNADGNVNERVGRMPGPESADLGYSETDMEGTRKRIGQDFFNDLLLLTMDREMTLGQFLKMAEEKGQLLGPYLGRLMSEHYNPIFDRTFSLLWTQGEIPPPPQILRRYGGELRIDYKSPLAKMQKVAESQGLVQVAGFVGQIAEMAPSATKVINWDDAVRQMAENIGVSQKLIRDSEEVQTLLQAEEKRAQQEKAAQMAMELAGKVPALGKAPEAGSPLDQVSQGLRQGAGAAGSSQ